MTERSVMAVGAERTTLVEESIPGPAGQPVRIAAVVVTYNRLALLEQCITAVRQQTRPVDEIIVVNNGSTDGTADWLASQAGLVVVTQENQGGAGGFNTAIRVAFERGHDWFWCMDDDTLPRPDALERIVSNCKFQEADVGYLASLVVWKDGQPHALNLPHLADSQRWLHTIASSPSLPITANSFVSMLVARRAVEAVGLPIREFYIWLDDTEYSTRISRRFASYLITDSVVVHATAENRGCQVHDLRPGDFWKYKYGVRNQVYMIRAADSKTRQKASRLIRLLMRQVGWCLRGRIPWSVLAWWLRGMFFNPSIEFPIGCKSTSSSAPCSR